MKSEAVRFLVLMFFVGMTSVAEGRLGEPECGTVGTVAQRIRDCDLLANDKLGEIWELVTFQRTFFANVWIVRQKTNGALWMGNFEASYTAASSACTSGSTHPQSGGIQADWVIASEDDYRELWKSGANEFVASEVLAAQFWIDQKNTSIDVVSWVTQTDDPKSVRPVVCVAR